MNHYLIIRRKYLRLLFVLTILVSLPDLAGAQSNSSFNSEMNSRAQYEIENSLDSVELIVMTHYRQMQTSYDSTIGSASSRIDSLYGKIDSPQKQGLPTEQLTFKLDSLIALRDKNLEAITSKFEKLKSSVNDGINSLDLPPELRGKANELTSLMDKFDITNPNAFQDYLDLSVPEIPNMNIPDVNLNNPLPDVGNVKLPSINTGGIRDIGGQIKEYQNVIGELPTDVDGVAKLAEENVENVSALNEVQGELGKVSEVTNLSDKLQDQEALKKELMQEARKQAVDHFADKKEVLSDAMKSISKYKQKFSTIGSLNDIPKKAPNEMKGKPLIERIVPGIAFQLQKKNDDLLLDINPYLAYRFTKRFSSGAGWNQRVGYNTDKNTWSPNTSKIYGPRIFSEYKIGKGFSPRVEIETMNTFVPPYIKINPTDPGRREWVFGAFAGIKKDYTIYKKIKGTASVVFRLFDPHRKSPYADVVNARFGFEFPVKKKAKKATENIH